MSTRPSRRPKGRGVGRKNDRLGQSTVEYLLVVAVISVFAIKLAGFFTQVFEDGLEVLEETAATEVSTQTTNGF